MARFDLDAEASPGVALTRDLIRRPSVTPADAGALDILQARLDVAGFKTQRLPFSEPGTPDIDNLYARIGDSAPFLLFAGHTDVVPPGDSAKWSVDPFAGEIIGGELYGRGAADMKGGIAAFAAAAFAYLEKHGAPKKGSIGFLITGDEEGPAINGTVKMLQWLAARGEKFDHCIVGEPTNAQDLGDMIKIGRRGSLNGRLLVLGKQGHVAYPQRADNPVPHLLALCAALKAEPLDNGTDWFDASNLEITSIDIGNEATNVIPGAARVRFNIRFNDRWTPQTLEAEIRRRLLTARPAGPVRAELRPLQRRLLRHQARTTSRKRWRRPSRPRPAGGRTSRPRAAPPTPASSPNMARWWNSAWSARPCTRSTSASPSPTSTA